MGKTTLVEIDGEKLERLISKRGLSLREASEEIGYSRWFLSNCKSRGVINKSALIGLQSKLNVTYEDLKKEEPEIIKVLKEEPKAEETGIDYERLWKVIYTATKKAMEEVFEHE